MRRLFAITVLVLCAPALASTYDDFAKGIEATNHGDANAAIVYFTRSIDGGDLAPSYLPSAHLGRARAYLHDRRCNLAYADLTDAIRLKSDLVDAYSLRAEANHCLKHDDAALADATAAIRIRPAAGYFFTRSRLLWNRGDFGAAHADAEKAAATDPGNAYFVLWSALTSLRTGRVNTTRLERVALSAGDDWPRPLIELFAGQTTPQDVWRLAADTGEKCEADFYIGQWQLSRGEQADAKKLFGTAVAQCPHDYIAFDAAQHELNRMQDR